MMNTAATSRTHTLVFHLRGLSALEVTMGTAVTQSALNALRTGLSALKAAILKDEAKILPIAGLPRGVWGAHYESPARAADAQAEKQATILLAATQLGMELAKQVFGNATAAFARLHVALLPGHPDAAVLLAQAEEALPPENAAAERALRQVLAHHTLRTFLQPIVAFPDAWLLGFEALTRGQEGSPVEHADQLFGVAARMGLSRELEITCAWQALQWLERLPAHQWLSINLSVLSLTNEKLRRALARPRIVVELTEHLPLNDARSLLPMIAELRAGGARLALDDTGCGFADLQAIEILRPDFIKLCITIIRSVKRDPAQVLRELETTIARLRNLGVGILAEGVESEEEARLLSALDIDYAQGWLYGKPRPADCFLAAD
ncbi:MAG: EAL domain-containing protein [Zoogloeaceae bacterium]|jgi:EAL domain-containing protein (putative c-di-GMP-specific phosphodiesterase class I)|nr:EAL domain-containing protein [Zoogloeaceae bacterium]